MNRLKLPLPISFKTFQESLVKSRHLTHISNLSKEEMMIKRLESKLGVSRNEVKQLISTDLMSLLIQVPTSEDSNL